MDNTGSMEGLFFNEIMEDDHADFKFVQMMRAFREMERIFIKPPTIRFSKTNRPRRDSKLAGNMRKVFIMILVRKEFI